MKSRIVAPVLLLGSLALAASAQQPGIKRTDIERHDLSAPGYEVIQVRVDFASGAAFGRHSHPGAEVAFVLEGTLEYRFEDKSPVTLEAGEALFTPAGAVHSARNVSVGGGKAAELATYIVERGKPLVVLARRVCSSHDGIALQHSRRPGAVPAGVDSTPPGTTIDQSPISRSGQ